MVIEGTAALKACPASSSDGCISTLRAAVTPAPTHAAGALSAIRSVLAVPASLSPGWPGTGGRLNAVTPYADLVVGGAAAEQCDQLDEVGVLTSQFPSTCRSMRSCSGLTGARR